MPGLVLRTTAPGLLGPHSPLPSLLRMMEEEEEEEEEKEEEEEASYKPENSRSAVFSCGHDGPRTIKLIVTLPAALP
jgi:hypothetical protein